MQSNANYEDVDQAQIFKWAEWMSGKHPELEFMYHVPNGGMRNKATAGKLKAQGVKAGVPDICLPYPCGGYHGLYIELKRSSGGRLSKSQKRYIEKLSGFGYRAVVCNGYDEAVKEIEKYLSAKH